MNFKRFYRTLPGLSKVKMSPSHLAALLGVLGSELQLDLRRLFLLGEMGSSVDESRSAYRSRIMRLFIYDFDTYKTGLNFVLFNMNSYTVYTEFYSHRWSFSSFCGSCPIWLVGTWRDSAGLERAAPLLDGTQAALQSAPQSTRLTGPCTHKTTLGFASSILLYKIKI